MIQIEPAADGAPTAQTTPTTADPSAPAAGALPSDAETAGRVAALAIHLTLTAAGLTAWLAWVRPRARRWLAARRSTHTAAPPEIAPASAGSLLKDAPGRPNRLSPAVPIIIFAIWLGVQMLTVTIATAVLHGRAGSLADLPADQRTRVQITTAIAGPIAMAAACVAAAVYTFAGGAAGIGLSVKSARADFKAGLAACLMIWPLYLGLLLAATAFLEAFDVPVSQHPLLEALRGLSAGWRVAAAVSAIVLAPVAEELFFRGVVQSMFRRLTGSPRIGILLASAIFAGVHVPVWQGMPALFVLAVMMGYLYERSGRLTAPIVLHAAFNLANFTVASMQ